MEGTCIGRAGALPSAVPPRAVFVKAWSRGPASQQGSLGNGMRKDRGPSAGQVQEWEQATDIRGLAAGVCWRTSGGL